MELASENRRKVVQLLADLGRKFPSVDVAAYFDRLEKATDLNEEFEMVTVELESLRDVPQQEITDSVPSRRLSRISSTAAAQIQERILDKVQIVMEIFPNANANLVYEMLEEAAKTGDDLDAKVETILMNFGLKFEPRRGSESFASKMISNSPEAEFLTETERDLVKKIFLMFPDVDPMYVVKEVVSGSESLDLNDLINKMTGENYPKLRDRMKEELQERLKAKYLDARQFKVEEFLQIFQDPEAYFTDTSRSVSQLYISHAIAQLQNDFSTYTEKWLRDRLAENSDHYLPTFRAIEKLQIENVGWFGRLWLRNRQHFNDPDQYRKELLAEPVKFPEKIDETFMKELQYAMHVHEIVDFQENKKQQKAAALDQAKKFNILLECSCCTSEEVLAEDILDCGNKNHGYCKECIKQHAKTLVGNGEHKIKCMIPDCGNEYSLILLKSILNSQMISLILRRTAVEDLRVAGIQGLKACKYCDFQMIIENPQEKVFRCQNIECLQEFCLLCEEPNHIPLKCGEAQKAETDDETAMRKFIENSMAEALIRTCPKCANRIVKESGCNTMTCPCGAKICYMCRQLLDATRPYAHFSEGNSGGCTLYSNEEDLHAEAAIKAGTLARNQYLRQHAQLVGRNRIDLNALVNQRSKAKLIKVIVEGNEYRVAPHAEYIVDSDGNLQAIPSEERAKAITVSDDETESNADEEDFIFHEQLLSDND